MADEAQSILTPIQADNSVKADAWQAFKDSANEQEFGTRIRGLSLPDNVKADLWEAKRRAGAAQPAPLAQPTGIPDAVAQARATALRPLTSIPRPVGDVLSQSGNAANPTPQTGAPDPGTGTLNALPAVGGAVGGTFGGVPGAMLGGIGGEGLKQMIQPSANPPASMLGQGALQGAFEGGGQLLSAAGKALAPAALKRVAGSLLTDRMASAGKAIDQFLTQPPLASKTVDIATPVNTMLDAEIAKATRTGSDTLANRLTQLKATWNANYNLVTPTLLQANQFRREIGDFTTFAGEANKDTINKVQRQVVGIVGDKILGVAGPGLRPLNDTYANLVATQGALKQSAKKATTGFSGTGLSMASAAAKKAGAAVPNIARAAQVAEEQ